MRKVKNKVHRCDILKQACPRTKGKETVIKYLHILIIKLILLFIRGKNW